MLFCPPTPAPSGHPSVPAVGMLFAGTRTRETANAICRECLSRIEKDTKEVLDSEKESYYSKNNNPISDILAIESVKLVMNNLKNAVNNLDNIEYRENMCQASLLAGIAFSVTGTAACHGISYPLTSKYNIPHGEACGITQDKVLLLNSKVEFDRIDKLSKQVGYSNVEEFSNEIYKLKKGIGLANNLRDYNIKKDELETIASLCTSLNILANPYELNKEEILKLLQSIY